MSWVVPVVAGQPPSDQPKTANPAFYYTLQIDQGSDLATVEKTANYIAQLLPLRVRIVKEMESYSIRSGKSRQSDDLENLIAALKSEGFFDTTILYLQTEQEVIAKVINPDAPESVDQQSNQPYLLHAQQQESPRAARRMIDVFPAELEVSRMLRLKKQMDNNVSSKGDSLIQQAWEAYRHGSLAIACELFENAQNHPELKLEASRGLAHCFFQMGQYDQAVTLLTELLQQGVTPGETRTLLVETLFKSNQYDSALKEAQLLDKPQAQQWIAIISPIIKEEQLKRARKQYDPGNPKAFVDEYRTYLDQCLLSDLFLATAWHFLQAKDKAAESIFEQLFNGCKGKWDVRQSAYIGLSQLVPLEKHRAIINQELALKNLPPAYRQRLLADKIGLLNRMIFSLPEGHQTEALYREILSLNPGDKGAQTFLAWWYFNQHDYSTAHDYFTALHRHYPDEKAITEGLALTLARLDKLDEAISLAETTGSINLQTDFLREKLSKTPADSNEAMQLEQRILALNPNDTNTLNALAWWHYHHDDYQQSVKLFKKLSFIAPDNSDYRTGLINALLKLDRLDEAFKEFQQAGLHQQQLEVRLYRMRANRYFQNKEYQESQADLKKVLGFLPDDPDARLLMGWCHYFQKESKAAMGYFLDSWREHQDAGAASVLPGLFDELGLSEEKSVFLHQMAQSTKPELRKILADYFAGQGHYQLAAEAFNDAESPYFNANQPSATVNYLHRSRSGSRGTGYLEQQGSKLTYKKPLAKGQAVSFDLTVEHLTAGSVSDFSKLSVGTVGVGDKTMQHALLTSADLITPTIKFQVDGDVKQSYQLGTTPLNGTLTPTATAMAQLKGANWLVNAHQEPIIQSLLSYTGLNDPFSDKSWGRVVRSGANGSYTVPLAHDYWLSFAARTDYYWGKNVKGNFAAEGGVTGGRSVTLGDGSLTLGVFLTNIHFDHNVNFYTYGHGGYFSPNYLFVVGPFLNYEYKTGKKIWWKTELSTNRFHSEVDSAPIFPLQTLTDKHFDGSVKDGIGYRVAVEGRYLLTPHIDIGGRFSMEQAATFSDMFANFGVRIFFSPRNSLVEASD